MTTPKKQINAPIVVVGIDFSRASRNAASWAAAYCLKRKQRLQIVHIYQPPVVVSEGGVIVPPIDELQKEAISKLKRIKSSLLKKFGKNLLLDTEVVCGIPQRELSLKSQNSKVGLIVMGMTGASLFTERLIGSTSTSVMKESQVPVVTVHEKMAFETPKKIVLCTDYKEVLDQELLHPLKDIALSFSSQVTVLHVFPVNKTRVFLTEAETALKLGKLFKGVKHKFDVVHSDEPDLAIRKYCKEKKVNLLVMIPREHSIIERLFNEPLTKKMAFHAGLPLMTFADIQQ